MPSPCRVKVILTRVKYSGDDIGNDWEYKFKVANGRWVTIPEHTLNHGAVENRNDVLYDQQFGECDTQLTIPIWMWAREHDIFFDDYNRPTQLTVGMPCPSQNEFDRDHFVDERFTLFGRETAKITFRLQIIATCD